MSNENTGGKWRAFSAKDVCGMLKMSEEEAQEFLRRHAHEIADRLTECGYPAIVCVRDPDAVENEDAKDADA